jgi:hypothetical protein
VLANCLNQIIGGFFQQGVDPKSRDLIADMKTGINKRIGELAKIVADQKVKLPKVTDLSERFMVEKGEDNYLAQVLRGQVQAAQNQIKQMEAEQEAHRRALEFLKKYKFKNDAQGLHAVMGGLSMRVNSGSATTSGTNFYFGQ